MEIKCIKGMCMLRIVSNENNLGFKGLKCASSYVHVSRSTRLSVFTNAMDTASTVFTIIHQFSF